METVLFAPVGRCVRVVAGDAEALVTLDVGPRVIRYGRVGEPNLFKVFENGGPLGEGGCMLYGGHRLWAGPEVPEFTYHADNSPVEIAEDKGWLRFASLPDRQGVRKELLTRPHEDGAGLRLLHRLTNTSGRTLEVFPWCLTVMQPGGECLFPLPPRASHSEKVTPAAPLVLWNYTDLTDARWRLGPRVARLRQAEKPPQKLGALVREGCAAYALGTQVFFKRFPFEEGAPYPDFGCNFETFTMAGMLEIESLGPIARLGPGESAEHAEAWWVLDGSPPDDDEACEDWLKEAAARRSI